MDVSWRFRLEENAHILHSSSPHPFHRNSSSIFKKQCCPTSIHSTSSTQVSLLPAASFTQQKTFFKPQGSFVQPHDHAPHAGFGAPSSPAFYLPEHDSILPKTAPSACAINQHSGGSSKPFASILKQITDKLVNLESMSQDVLTHLKKLEKQADLIKRLKTRSDTLEQMIQQLTEQNETLELTVQGQGEVIDRLFALLEKIEPHAHDNSDEEPWWKKKRKTWDNYFNMNHGLLKMQYCDVFSHQNAIQKMMLLAMGLGLRAKVKDITQLKSHGGEVVLSKIGRWVMASLSNLTGQQILQEIPPGMTILSPWLGKKLDPDTDIDEGEEVPVALTLKPWIMHLPLYQTTEVSISGSCHVYAQIFEFSLRNGFESWMTRWWTVGKGMRKIIGARQHHTLIALVTRLMQLFQKSRKMKRSHDMQLTKSGWGTIQSTTNLLILRIGQRKCQMTKTWQTAGVNITMKAKMELMSRLIECSIWIIPNFNILFWNFLFSWC